jgi:hypothetical protein
MADHVIILHVLDDTPDAERILGEFERRTGLAPEVQGDDRYYEMHDGLHRERIVHTLTAIDARWTDHIGVKIPG